VIYWASSRDPAFREDKKITLSWPVDGRERGVEIPLGRIIQLLLDRPITALRLDFTARPAYLACSTCPFRQICPSTAWSAAAG